MDVSLSVLLETVKIIVVNNLVVVLPGLETFLILVANLNKFALIFGRWKRSLVDMVLLSSPEQNLMQKNSSMSQTCFTSTR